MFKQADTKKHVSEHNCSSVKVFLSILAHLAQSFFFSDFFGINRYIYDVSMQR